MSIKVEGLKKLSRELKAIDTGLQKELKQASKDGAEIVAAETRDRAPVLTGALERSVKSAATMAGGTVTTGASLPYAKPIVFGWERHNIAPNPFPYDALDARRDEVFATFEKQVKAIIDKSITPGTGD